MFSEVDLENWNRKATFQFFKDFEDPFFNITAPLDATRLSEFCKDRKLSFSLANLFHSLQTANDIREFRIRLSGGKLIEFDKIHATQTILNDDETFSFAYFELKDSVFEFEDAGRRAVEKYKTLKSFDVESHRLDVIYHSVIPWVSFTSFKHASRFDNQRTVPRMVFGKLYDDQGRKLIPLSVEVHHAIVDGFHVGRFFNELQKRFDDPE